MNTLRFQFEGPQATPQAQASATQKPCNRSLVGFDAVRAFAALGVVLLHACVPYLQNPMPGLCWSVRDQSSLVMDCVFWGIEVFIMPLFLMLAGFFAWQTLSRRGARQLITTRARRLLIPLGFAVCVVLPIELYTWVLAWVAEGIVEAVKLKSLKFDGVVDRDLWGLSHLWFMLYLFLYGAATSAIAVGVARSRTGRSIIERLSQPRTLFACLVGIGFVVVSIAPEVVWGFQHAFAPVPSKWIYSGTFFVGGLWIASNDPSWSWVRENTKTLAICSVMLLVAAVTLGRWHLSSGALTDTVTTASLSVVTVSAAWSVSLFVSGLSLSIRRIPRWLEYFAAASFWVYLLHHPILGLAHLDLKLMMPSVGPIAKAMMSFSISMTVSLLTYEALVRRSKFGKWLGMSFEFAEPDAAEPVAAEPVAAGSAPQVDAAPQSDDAEHPWSRAA
ncbi:glucans biosynthesis protein [Planctomycetes bacterium CA13]|uniref:Glucans biosynthesis protein n=1 Tax=Novipirellula herctigrandis TaxID=2527986 RepID=A0A5C5YX51_9BACT|nr:glucans biosynthesis protein [Planctomycetes bacterium CA13]